MPKRTSISIELLIDDLYSAAIDPAHWDVFLGHLARATNSETAQLHFHDPNDGEVALLRFHGIGPEAAAEYVEWGPRNVYVQAAAPFLETGAVIRSPIERKLVLESAFYRDFVSHHARVCDTMGACILREGDVLSFVSVLRALNKPDYSIDDERILRRLAPHLRRAFEVHRRLVSAELTRAASIEVLDAVETGVFLLDEDRRVLFENAAARRILARADGIAVTREGRLTATSPSARSRLERCVAEACRTGVGDGSEAGGSFAVERARHALPYGVIVSPLRMPATPSIARRPAAVVLIGDPERPAPLPRLLREVFGLTPAQSAFAAQLAGGDSVEASAEALGITVGTARWTLKQIFLRTGTSRQSELVRLIDSLPRRPDDGKS